MREIPKAFPYMQQRPDGVVVDCDYGMDLRDYFAAKAMQGLIQIVRGCELGRDGSTIMPDSIRLSNVAYGIADGMMKAREQK